MCGMDTTTHPMVRALAAGIRANVATLLWGSPGVGKTALVNAWGAAWGYHVETLVGSIREPVDFLGLPIEEGGVVRYAPPAWAQRLADAPKGLGFFDELSTVAPSVQRAMLRILQEREVGELSLPDSVSLVAAANPPEIAVDGWELAAPLANRFMHLEWHFDVDAYLDGVVTDFAFGSAPSMDSLLGDGSPESQARAKGAIAAFLRTRPDMLLKVPSDPSKAGKGWPSPRSWRNAMCVVGQLDRKDEDGTYTAVAGCVGEDAAIEFTAWLASADLYDPMEVLRDPSIVDFTARPDRIFALLGAVSAIVLSRGDKATWERGMAVVTACAAAGRPDVAHPATSAMLRSIPKGARPSPATVRAFSSLFSRMGTWAA